MTTDKQRIERLRKLLQEGMRETYDYRWIVMTGEVEEHENCQAQDCTCWRNLAGDGNLPLTRKRLKKHKEK